MIADSAFVTSKENVPTVADAGDFERDQAFSMGLWLKMGEDKDGSIIARMDEDDAHRGWDLYIDGRRPGIHLAHKWPEDAIKVVSKKGLEKDKWSHVFITYDGSSKA